ncbi:glycosyltransferase family 2 protein [Litoreibacter roseus]|uniref:Glycosyl transferase family 2 n=1 Tax=Litoreibacter roseus TaxID=2601869 RepID=A0A6N6JCG8_9RHOB|nr:glycosyltransferase family 2 protein [Litoreibacter roseus]GFE64023.1 hypothetical protein KIN_10970 [Litoreibacter roseus]
MKITVVTTMRNEAPHALEWIAHHRALGVTDFVIYTNDCEDGTGALLDLLPDVHHLDQSEADGAPQWAALRAAWDHPAVANADWLSCLDCDEFVNLDNALSGVPDLIDAVSADAIVLRWRLFGNDGHLDFSDQPTTERYTRAAPANMPFPPIGSYFKTLFRKDGPFRQFGVHRPKQKNPDRHGVPTWVDGSGQPIVGALAANDGQIMHWRQPIARNLVQLNHYSVRSAADFMIKRDRGLPNHREKPLDLTYWVERNFNAVEETSIAHHRPRTETELEAFMAISGVTEAVEAGQAWHRARFAALMKDPEELKLYGRLVLANGSTPPNAAKAMELVEAYGAAHGG